MALKYKVLSDEDIATLRCLPKGDYDFYVAEISERKSRGGLDKNGKPKKIYDMLEVKLKIVLADNTERQVRDWIMLVDEDDAMGFKLRHFAMTCGLLTKYQAHTLEVHDFLEKHGKVKLTVKDYTDGQTGELMKSNSVVDYIKPLPSNTPIENGVDPGKPFDDDIPFG
jgi:hypothetical protein